MTSRPHDLNGEEPARNDYRGDRAERHLTVRGCAARGGFGASSIRQPRGALNTMICALPQLRSAQALLAPIRRSGRSRFETPVAQRDDRWSRSPREIRVIETFEMSLIQVSFYAPNGSFWCGSLPSSLAGRAAAVRQPGQPRSAGERRQAVLTPPGTSRTAASSPRARP
jgi:hypothetical protein